VTPALWIWQSVETRQFPIAVIYHSIVTACVWFMVRQQRQRNRDVESVLKLRRTLEESIEENKKAKQKKK
jgi:hypothetical protein